MAHQASRPDDGPSEPDSVYRRRPAAVAVSRHRPRRLLWRALRWTGWGVFVVLPAAFLLMVLRRYLLHGPQFEMAGADAVVLTGNRNVTRADVMAALGAGAGPNIFRLSLDEERRQVEAIPWVESARLRRVAPDRLLVDVTERKPVAFVNVQGRMQLVDANGFLIDKPAEAAFDFPVISGVDAAMTPADRKARLALFDQFAQELRAQARGTGWLVSEVDLSDEADLKALLVQGRESILVHFGNQDFGARFRTFLSLLPDVERAAAGVDSVDLRYHGQVVVNPKASAQPTAARSAAAP